jgi:PTS system cellobiose-specific IIB component
MAAAHDAHQTTLPPKRCYPYGIDSPSKEGSKMIKIRLFCAGGMSTSLLVTKMRKAAQEQGIEADIEAHGVGSIERYLDADVDAVLLGPQVGYQKAQAAAACDKFGIPCEVIPMTDYGMVNGKAVFALAQRMAQGK